MYQIIDGKKIAQEIKEELKEQVAALKADGKTLCLAVIQVGNDPASSVYVGNKINALKSDKKVNGILVQLPLPQHIDEETIIQTISPDKDVDGFHMRNVGALCVGSKGFVSCTPLGIFQL